MMPKSIISYLVNHPEFALRLLSQYFTFTPQQLKRYADVLIWEIISNNSNIRWTSETLWKYAERLDWNSISMNPSAFADIDMLNEFDAFIEWKGLGNGCFDSIANNAGLPWTEEFIKSVEHKINFEKLSTNESVQWSETIIDRYKGKWDIVDLASNESVPWTLTLFERHLDESHFFYYGVETNPAILRNFDMVEKYYHKIEWWVLFSSSVLPWKEMNLMERWRDHIDWYGLSLNEYFFRTDSQFFAKNIDKWLMNNCRGFTGLSSNQQLPWTSRLIEKYLPFWCWTSLCTNEAIPWNEEMIDYFTDYVEWGGTKPCGIYNEEGEMIAPTGGKSYEFGLVNNKNLPWSMEFLNRYESQIEPDDLRSNSAVWEKAFKPYVDDKIVDTVLRII